jgi:hypothetical protein
MSGSRQYVLALTVLSACGLRSDPDFEPQCQDDDAETDGDDSPASCMNPVTIPVVQSSTVQGVLGGCSNALGYCGGSGGEDVYEFVPPVAGDVTVTFRPDLTEVDPVLRVVQGEPCGEAPISATEVCADIVNEFPGRSFFADPVDGPVYIIVDSERGESGAYGFEFGWGAVDYPTTCEEHLEEQAIVLGLGGNFQWNDSLEEGQGLIDGSCGGQGTETLFRLTINSPGTLTATVASDSFEPVVTVRPKCFAYSELMCGLGQTQGGIGVGEWILAVDTNDVNGGPYSLTVTLD